MTYLAYLPSLICGIAVSVEDIRRRRVPRLWIAIGCLTQLVAVIIVAVMANTMFLLVQAPLFAVLSAVLQAGRGRTLDAYLRATKGRTER